MDQNVPKLYREYGQYINESRAFPLALDGLKPAERRVLLTTYLIARNKSTKSAKVDGYATGNFHPHGSCIVGDTRIPLLDGTEQTIEELCELKEPFWVYSCKSNGEVVPGLAHSARITKEVNTLCKLTFDNGETLFCTEDHLIMLRDGNYRHASDLICGSSLMPFRLRVDDGYSWYYNNSIDNISEKVCYMVLRNFGFPDITNLVKNFRYHTHHKNSNRIDDRPENLDLLTIEEHASITGKNLPADSRKEIGKKLRDLYYNDLNRKELMLKGLEKGRETMFSENSPIRERIRQKNSKLITAYNKIASQHKILKVIKKIIDQNKEVNFENYEIIRKEFYNYPKWENITKKFKSVEEAISVVINNHKLESVEIITLEQPVKVYDMSVDKYHNFAISSGVFVHNCYGTIVSLVHQGFLIGQGNFGSNVGADSNPPAASRYTEVKLDPKMIQLAFKYISYVDWKMNDLNEKEPDYLPVMFPLTLMGTEYTQGIGFGYRTYIPCYKITDLQKRLLWLLGELKTEPIIKPITDCVITSNNKVLKELLTTGKAKIGVEGVIKINKRSSLVTLKSWPPGKRFEVLLNKFSKELDNQDIGFTDLSSTETNIVFQVLKQRNQSVILNSFIEKLKVVIKGFISFETIVVDKDQEIKLKSIDDMLIDTFNMYLNTNKIMLEYEINKIQDIIEEMKMLIKIKPFLSEVLLLKEDIKTSISLLSTKSGVDESIISKLFSKYNINKLLTVNTDTTKLEESASIHKNNLDNLKTFVIKQYKGE